jgi:hypothetical protein
MLTKQVICELAALPIEVLALMFGHQRRIVSFRASGQTSDEAGRPEASRATPPIRGRAETVELVMGTRHSRWPAILMVFGGLAASGLFGWHLGDRTEHNLSAYDHAAPYQNPWPLLLRR